MNKRNIKLIKGIIRANNLQEEKTRILQAKMADGLVTKYVACEDCGSAIKIQMSLIDYIKALTDRAFTSLVCDKCFEELFTYDSSDHFSVLVGEYLERHT